MPKHRRRESFKSISGSRVDPEKDEEPKGTKAEELRKKAHGEHGSDNSSSRSDSADSDESPKKKGAGNGKVEIDSENYSIGFRQAIEKAIIEETEALIMEDQRCLSREHEARRIITALVDAAGKWEDEKSKLLSDNADLEIEMESSHKLQAELNQKLEEIKEERDRLRIENSSLSSKISLLEVENKQAESKNEELGIELRQFRIQFSHHLSNLEVLKKEAMEKLELADNEAAMSSQMLKASQEENTSLSLKMSQLEDETKLAENRILELASESSKLIENLAEKERALSSLQEIHLARKEEAKVKLERAENKIAKLSLKQKTAEEEKTGLSSKIAKLEDEMNLARNKIQELATESRQLGAKLAERERELASHLVIHESYKEEATEKLESAENEIAKLKEMQKAAEEEKTSFSSKILQLEDDVKQAENSIQELVTNASQLQEKITEKERELSRLLEMHGTHKEEAKAKLESAENEIVNLLQMQKITEEEKDSLSSKILQLEDDVKWAEIRIQDLVTESSHLSEKLTEKEGELSSHLEIHEAHKEEARMKLELAENDIFKLKEMQKAAEEENDSLSSKISQRIVDTAKRAESLQQHMEMLENVKTQLEDQIEKGKQESMEKLIQAQNHIAGLVTKLNEQEDAFLKLFEEHKHLEIQCEGCKENLKSSEKKIEEMTQTFHKDIDLKDEVIEDLKRELEMKADEIRRLEENMHDIELKQKLTSQKLRATEQSLIEKDESHLKIEGKFLEEKNMLVEMLDTYTWIIAEYKETQENILAEISEKVNEKLYGMDTFTAKFEEDYGRLESRVNEIVNEVKSTANWIKKANEETTRLKNEIASLVGQVKLEKEQAMYAREVTCEMETTLRKYGAEKKSLILTRNELEKQVAEKEKKTKELEQKMNAGFLSLSEEKREAIRQLCICIDYHRSRYDDLKDMISETRGGGGRLIAS